MLFGQVLQFVVIQIASQADGGKDHDLPVAQSLASSRTGRVSIDVLSDAVQKFFSQLRAAINVLQGFQDGNDFVAALKIESHVRHRLTIESQLTGKGLSHEFVPRR